MTERSVSQIETHSNIIHQFPLDSNPDPRQVNKATRKRRINLLKITVFALIISILCVQVVFIVKQQKQQQSKYNQLTETIKQNAIQLEKERQEFEAIKQSLLDVKNNNSLNLLKSDNLSNDLKNKTTYIEFLLNGAREKFHDQKVRYLQLYLGDQIFKQQRVKYAYLTALDNLKLPHINKNIQNIITEADQKIHDILAKDYKFSEYPKQLPFCLVVPTYNNARWFRYEYNLQSMVNLNYTNYKIVIVDDISTDNTYDLIQDLIKSKYANKPITLVRNKVHMTALFSINMAIKEYCPQDSIIVLVDGDDQLLVKDTLKVFNTVFQQNNVDIVYSDHIQIYWHRNEVHYGWSSSFTEDEKANNRYRDIPQKISHLRTFKASLYRKINQSQFKDSKGEWYRATYDQVMFVPMFQISCGRIMYIRQFLYLYNFEIGSNDYVANTQVMRLAEEEVKKKKKLKCIKD